jgi:hypothetical protein
MLALLGAGAWLLRPLPAPPELEATPAPLDYAIRTRPEPEPTSETTTADYTAGGIRIRPAGSAPIDARGMAPHPVTPQHRRIFRENNLIGSLNGAMDVQDAAGLRRLLERYREEYPEDSHVLQDGYAIIADCLERPGAETRAVAQRYYDEQLDSGLRRYIRRHCLES